MMIRMRLFIFLLLFISVNVLSMCCCRRKKQHHPEFSVTTQIITIPEPTKIHSEKDSPSHEKNLPSHGRISSGQNALNNRLFEAITYGWPDTVKTVIESKADVHAVDPHGKRAMYRAAELATLNFLKDVDTSNEYVKIIKILSTEGASHSEDLAEFLNQEPINKLHAELTKKQQEEDEKDDEEEENEEDEE